MTSWVLDDGPYHALAAQFDAAWDWSGASLNLVAEVANSAVQDKSGRREKLLSLKSAAGVSSLKVRTLIAGSPEADVLWKLRPLSTTATGDLGEDASMALCLSVLTDAVFVTMDKAATFRALGELGRGRVATPFELWDEMERSGLISKQARHRLEDAYLKSVKGALTLPLRFSR